MGRLRVTNVPRPLPCRAVSVARPDPQRRIVIVGMMAVGKTTVGTALASRLGWRYWDNDVELERDTGRDVRTLVAQLGVDAAHAEETRVLQQALALGDPVVVAAAGSVVADPAAVALLQREWVVWLRASLETIQKRIRAGAHRPFLDAHLTLTLQQLDAARRGTYQRLAATVVDVDALTVDQCVAQILAARDRDMATRA